MFFFNRFKNHFNVSNEEFVAICYAKFLGRKSDPEGKKNAVLKLRRGLSKLDFIKALVSSPEYFTVLTKQLFGETALPDLTKLRPGNYARIPTMDNAGTVTVFRAGKSADFDWLAEMIAEHGYYEQPGVWSLAIDDDKRLMADIARKFRPARCLEIGCSTGAVIKLLNEAGVDAEGVEVSHFAVAHCYPAVRRKIHFGDLTKLGLPQAYDLVIGLDIFEHIGPDHVAGFVEQCSRLLKDGGFLFTNIPAHGTDAVFGEVFPLYLQGWVTAGDQPFPVIHVDERGWPLHGHLTWATSGYWQKLFEDAGLRREADVERALHNVYDATMRISAPARMSFYVFSKNASREAVNDIVRGVKNGA